MFEFSLQIARTVTEEISKRSAPASGGPTKNSLSLLYRSCFVLHSLHCMLENVSYPHAFNYHLRSHFHTKYTSILLTIRYSICYSVQCSDNSKRAKETRRCNKTKLRN